MLNMVRVQLEAYAEHERIGREQGEEIGRKEGQKTERIRIVQALLKRKVKVEEIVEVTGMTKEEVMKLKDEKLEA